ncbi:MutS-related protein [Pedobacter nyackensis]|uniref:MutS-related protein n=1 Tax=Pedobacter nyackensis TaxID=475255 RepID=UPI0029302FCF|nr:DNA mismatch repair protein [Pedobacter nyackensis]
MSFNIDKQTLDELNLLGKFRQGSVYHLFNQVKTRGGEGLLDDMFHQPLQDHNAINERSSIFQFFQRSRFSFPFDVLQIDLMREYLDAGTGNNLLMIMGGTYVKRMLSSLTRDERYKEAIQGLQATIVTLKKCYTFLENIETEKGPYADKLKAIKKILSTKEIDMLLNTDIYTDLPVKTLAYFDYQLKNKLAEEMKAIMAFIYELDVYMAIGNVAEVKGFNYAKALPEERNVLSATDLRHPCIDGAIGNSLHMNEETNVVFLTGANMAGKSTLMKSLGIVMYLAHMGFPVAAQNLDFSVRAGMYTSINVADNIGLGYSHFYAEVVRVKEAAIAAASGKRLVLMFDELFKGTNVKDAYDGTLAVTEAFSEYLDCLFVVSTHIIEVGEALREIDNIHFAYMPTVMEDMRPRYTYRLQEGITEDRQGMMIIRNEGILELLA